MQKITEHLYFAFFLFIGTAGALVLIVVCYFPPRIVTMTNGVLATVPRNILAPGGTTVVTTPIWMVCTSMVRTTLKEWTGAFGKTLTIRSRSLRWRYVQKIFETFLVLCVKWSVCLWRFLYSNNRLKHSSNQVTVTLLLEKCLEKRQFYAFWVTVVCN